MKQTMALASLLIGLTLFWNVLAQAQGSDVPSKVEVGAQFSSLTRSSQSAEGLSRSASVPTGTDLAGFGGRFTFNFSKHVALEAEGNFFPHKDDGELSSGGQLLQGHFGVKAGKRFGKVGIFAKARPGFASFSRVVTQVGTTTIDFNGQPVLFPIFELKRKTHFSVDLGGVLEFYPSRRVLMRIDVGDTIIHHNNAWFLPSIGQTITFVPVSRTSHNFQLSAGIGFRLGSIQPEFPASAHGNDRQRFEVGVQFSSLSFFEIEHIPGSPPLIPPFEFRDTQTHTGFGGRFTFNVTPNFALEVQGDFFPRDLTLFNNARVGGRTLQGQAGIKVGKRFENFGIFGKGRPGVISFSNTGKFDGFDNSQGFPIPLIHLGRRTYFSMDVGGVLEFYPSSRIITRFDGGDTMIRFGSVVLPFGFTELVKTSAETTHNFQFSAGVGFRF
jgi:hypothetical protein